MWSNPIIHFSATNLMCFMHLQFQANARRKRSLLNALPKESTRRITRGKRQTNPNVIVSDSPLHSRMIRNRHQDPLCVVVFCIFLS